MAALSIIKSIGHWFGVGAKAAIKFEIAALPIETKIAQGVAVIDPPLGVTLLDILGIIGRVQQVATAIGVPSGNGVQKLAAALPDVTDLILRDHLFAGKTVIDPDKFQRAMVQFTSAFVDIADSIQSSAPPPPEPISQATPPAK